ncbi:MAG: hypothetical protein HY308_11515 [Gammaproteobacteria bacterium]|nr:hypothetical protein [Gammaproteobacteria bacterium]
MLFAGLVGGLAEVVWIVLYSQVSTLSAADVSRQVVGSVAPALAGSTFAPALEVTVHMALSVLLVLAFGLLVWSPLTRKRASALTIAASTVALALVWAINFFVVLPYLNPAFVSLMPYPVTFFSKLLFGLAAGWSLYRFDRGVRVEWIAVSNSEPIRGWR